MLFPLSMPTNYSLEQVSYLAPVAIALTLAGGFSCFVIMFADRNKM
jgi:hypothetical protein